jgi:hypothetical protein
MWHGEWSIWRTPKQVSWAIYWPSLEAIPHDGVKWMEVQLCHWSYTVIQVIVYKCDINNKHTCSTILHFVSFPGVGSWSCSPIAWKLSPFCTIIAWHCCLRFRTLHLHVVAVIVSLFTTNENPLELTSSGFPLWVPLGRIVNSSGPEQNSSSTSGSMLKNIQRYEKEVMLEG